MDILISVNSWRRQLTTRYVVLKILSKARLKYRMKHYKVKIYLLLFISTILA